MPSFAFSINIHGRRRTGFDGFRSWNGASSRVSLPTCHIDGPIAAFKILRAKRYTPNIHRLIPAISLVASSRDGPYDSVSKQCLEPSDGVRCRLLSNCLEFRVNGLESHARRRVVTAWAMSCPKWPLGTHRWRHRALTVASYDPGLQPILEAIGLSPLPRRS
jgi:hypothetical protein